LRMVTQPHRVKKEDEIMATDFTRAAAEQRQLRVQRVARAGLTLLKSPLVELSGW
jgi:superfamily I DNA/RNA helicase